MSFHRVLPLALAGAFVLAPAFGSAQAATTHKPMRHTASTHHAAPRGAASSSAARTDADHSADNLNAQSLSRAQGQ